MTTNTETTQAPGDCGLDTVGTAPLIRPVFLTRVEVTAPRTVGKTFWRDATGKLAKKTNGAISEGIARLVKVADLTDFKRLLEAAPENGGPVPGRDIFIYGRPDKALPASGEWCLVTEQVMAQLSPEDAAKSIARAKGHFHRPKDEPAIFFFDYDPRKDDDEVCSSEELIERLLKAAPGLAHVQMLVGSSSSSHICDGDGEIIGARGLRVYLIAADGSDVERAGQAMFDRLWLNGEGYILVSKSGGRLPRSLIDRAVFPPMWVDFVGGAVCGAGLEQRRPAMRLVNPKGAPMVNTREVFAPLSATERDAVEEKVFAVRAEAVEEAETARRAWAEARLVVEAEAALPAPERTPTGVAAKVAELKAAGRVEALMKRAAGFERGQDVILDLASVIHFSPTEAVTVGEILANVNEYDGRAWCDPVEPDYNNWHRTGSVYARTAEGFSFAHGTRVRYVLGTAPERVELRQARHRRVRLDREGVLQDLLGLPSLLGPAAIDTARAFAEAKDEGAMARLQERAKALREATVWSKRLRLAQKRGRAEESEARLAEIDRASATSENIPHQLSPGDAGLTRPTPIAVDEKLQVPAADPATFTEVAQRITRAVGRALKAFSFGNVVVEVRERQELFGRIFERDSQGNKMLDDDGNPVTRPARGVVAAPLDISAMATVASEVVTPMALNDVGELVPISLSGALLRDVKTNLERGVGLPVLAGVSSAPVYWGGRVLTGTGFHEATGLYLLAEGIQLEQWDDPHEAIDFLIEEWLGDFAFATMRDRAVAVCMFLTMLVRKGALLAEPVPIFHVGANQSGVGKSFLVDTLHTAVFGEAAGVVSYPEEETERLKTIIAIILRGGSVVPFDNLGNGQTLGRDHRVITQLATTAKVEGRVLGVSQTFKGFAGLTPIFTGNGVVWSADLARRVLVAKLHFVREEGDVGMLYRKFKHADLLGWTKENRGRLLGAAQAILRHQPTEKPAEVANFSAWTQAVAQPIIDLLTGEPMRGDAVVESDPERQPFDEGQFFAPWAVAAEENELGVVVANGAEDVLKEIAALPDPVTGEAQGETGSWFTAAEIARAIPAHVWNATYLKNSVNDKSVKAFLMRIVDQPIGAEVLTVRALAQVPLPKKRTNNRTAQTFRVERPAGWNAASVVQDTNQGRTLHVIPGRAKTGEGEN